MKVFERRNVADLQEEYNNIYIRVLVGYYILESEITINLVPHFERSLRV